MAALPISTQGVTCKMVVPWQPLIGELLSLKSYRARDFDGCRALRINGHPGSSEFLKARPHDAHGSGSEVMMTPAGFVRRAVNQVPRCASSVRRAGLCLGMSASVHCIGDIYPANANSGGAGGARADEPMPARRRHLAV